MFHKSNVINWDRFGSIIAFACAIHCLFLPFFIGLSFIFAHEKLELMIFGLSLIATFFSIKKAKEDNHLKLYNILIFLFGLLFLLISMVFHYHILSFLGGLLICFGHLNHWWLHKEYVHH